VSAKRLQYASLAVGILLSVTLIANTVLSTYILYTSSFTASMAEAPGEKLDVAVSADVGRPSPLDYLLKVIRGWTSAWFVGGQQRENATVSITISVTGSNVASTATANWYVEAREGAGTPYRFLEGNDTQVTVGGASLQASDRRSIESHLEAMGLSTTESHTIDYYVYVKAVATGAVSGEPLTSEITKTKFDTVAYSYGSEIEVSGKIQANQRDYEIKNGATFSNAVTQTPFMDDTPGSYESGLLFYPAACYFDVPQGATITGAYIRLKAGTCSGSNPATCTVTIRAERKGLYYNQHCSSVADFNARNRTTSEVVWGVPEWTGGKWYNSPDISSLIQEVVNEPTWTGGYRCVQVFLEDTTGLYASNYRHYRHRDNAAADAPLIYITYVSYEASWYAVPPLSIIDLPISLDLVAYTAIAAAALAIYVNRKERKRR